MKSLQSPRSIVYTSYDAFPVPKGASTHIEAFAGLLGRRFGNVSLVTLPGQRPESDGRADDDASGRSPDEQLLDVRPDTEVSILPGVQHIPLPADGTNFFERVLSFRRHLWLWWRQQFAQHDTIAEVTHFRSIFEGYPIARDKERFTRSIVYEVNALPSIELKYHYPDVATDRELLRKLHLQEEMCLHRADRIITVSQVTAGLLVRKGVPIDRIVVIPNGVDLVRFPYQAPSLEDRVARELPLRLIYSGTLAAWQGARIAVEALALFCRDFAGELTIVGTGRKSQRQAIHDEAWRLGIGERVRVLQPVSQTTLATMMHDADVVLAPLTPNDRNLVQGCCPLKVLEAMAGGTPLVTSDLAVVRELVRPEEDALLVRPGSAKAIKDALIRLQTDPQLGRRLSTSARRRVETHFTWSRAQDSLVAVYESLLRGSEQSPQHA